MLKFYFLGPKSQFLGHKTDESFWSIQQIPANVDISLTRSSSDSRWAREVLKKGKSSKLNGQDDEQVKWSLAMKV